jgi:hypothetical protein
VAKTAIRGVPVELPHASIYLDDLAEIESLLLSAASSKPEQPTISFEYEVDNSDRMTTHVDLREHGGSCDRFVMNVVSSQPLMTFDRVLVFNGFLNPELKLLFLPEETRWAIYGKVEQIFATRGDKGKALMESLPFAVRYLIRGTPLALLLLGAGVLGHKSPYRTAELISIAFLILLTGLESYFSFRPNKVFLRLSRHDHNEKVAIWKKRAEKLLWLLVGVGLGVIGDRMKH